MKNFRRIFVLFLCLSLLAAIGLSPLQVNANVAWAAGYAARAVAGSLIASGFDDFVKEPFVEACNGIADLLSQPLQKVLSLQEENEPLRYTLSKAFILEVVNIYSTVPAIRSKLGLDLNDTSADPVFVSEGTTIYVPTQSAMEQVDAITKDQVLYTGFERETIDLLTDIKYSLLRLPSQLSYAVSSSVAAVKDHVKNLDSNIITLYTFLEKKLTDVNDNIGSTYSFLEKKLTDVNDNIATFYSQVLDKVDVIVASVESGVDLKIKENLDVINSNLITTFLKLDQTLTPIESDLDNVRSNIVSTYMMLDSKISTISSNILSLYVLVRDDLKVLKDNVIAFPSYIKNLENAVTDKLDMLTDVITIPNKDTTVVSKPEIPVQVGAQTIVVSDYATMGKAFSAKMGWVPQAFDFLSELRSRLNSGTPPKVPIKLSAAEGDIDWGSDTYILDMSWYARYKPSVDTIISGIMWLCFGWAIYKRIPDILSGVGLTVENATQPSGHVFTDRAERAERRARYQKGG